MKDVRSWIVANLDAEVLPDAEMIWGRRVTVVGKPTKDTIPSEQNLAND